MWIVIDDAQITTIAISPEYRRKKLGEKLFGFSLQTALAMEQKFYHWKSGFPIFLLRNCIENLGLCLAEFEKITIQIMAKMLL